MALVTYDDLRFAGFSGDQFDLVDETVDEVNEFEEFLDAAIKPASRRLKRWVGLDAYTDAALENPIDPIRSEDLAQAEKFLAAYELLTKHFARDASGQLLDFTVDDVEVKVKGIGVQEKELQLNIFLERAEFWAYPYLLSSAAAPQTIPAPVPEIEVEYE